MSCRTGCSLLCSYIIALLRALLNCKLCHTAAVVLLWYVLLKVGDDNSVSGQGEEYVSFVFDFKSLRDFQSRQLQLAVHGYVETAQQPASEEGRPQ